MKRFLIFGDCTKHDFVLAAAKLLHLYSEKDVLIVTDNARHYQHMDQLSGIEIEDYEVFTHGDRQATHYVLYDLHELIPNTDEIDGTLLATSFEKTSIEAINRFTERSGMTAEQLMILASDSIINEKYIERNLTASFDLFGYYESSRRQIDWIHEQHINLKVDKDFAEALNTFLTDIVELPAQDLKKLWVFARKRG